mgnify:CR=1 FL=1
MAGREAAARKLEKAPVPTTSVLVRNFEESFRCTEDQCLVWDDKDRNRCWSLWRIGAAGGLYHTVAMSRDWKILDICVAEAEVRLVESGAIPNGAKFLLTDMTHVSPEDIGVHAMKLFPAFDAATTLDTAALPRKVERCAAVS